MHPAGRLPSVAHRRDLRAVCTGRGANHLPRLPGHDLCGHQRARLRARAAAAGRHDRLRLARHPPVRPRRRRGGSWSGLRHRRRRRLWRRGIPDPLLHPLRHRAGARTHGHLCAAPPPGRRDRRRHTCTACRLRRTALPGRPDRRPAQPIRRIPRPDRRASRALSRVRGTVHGNSAALHLDVRSVLRQRCPSWARGACGVRRRPFATGASCFSLSCRSSMPSASSA